MYQAPTAYIALYPLSICFSAARVAVNVRTLAQFEDRYGRQIRKNHLRFDLTCGLGVSQGLAATRARLLTCGPVSGVRVLLSSAPEVKPIGRTDSACGAAM
jgi:hypothetical protein